MADSPELNLAPPPLPATPVRRGPNVRYIKRKLALDQPTLLPGPSHALWREGRKRKSPPAKKKSPPKKKKSTKRKKKSPKRKGQKLIVKINFPKRKKSEYHNAGHSGDFESPKRRSPRLASQAPIGASRTDDTSLPATGNPFSHTIVAPKSSSSATVFEPASPFAPTHTSTAKQKKGKHVCPYCGTAFTKEENLKRHILTVHEDPEGYRHGRWTQGAWSPPTSPRTTPRTSPTSPPRRKREKYHCKYCLDAFPTQEQRDMHEINKHNAWLLHPGFLAPKLPDRMFSHDW